MAIIPAFISSPLLQLLKLHLEVTSKYLLYDTKNWREKLFSCLVKISINKGSLEIRFSMVGII